MGTRKSCGLSGVLLIQERSVSIPSTVTSIGDSAFFSCNSLKSIYVYAATPPTLSSSSYAFDKTSTFTIYVPAGSLQVYKTATGWSSYASNISPM